MSVSEELRQVVDLVLDDVAALLPEGRVPNHVDPDLEHAIHRSDHEWNRPASSATWSYPIELLGYMRELECELSSAGYRLGAGLDGWRVLPVHGDHGLHVERFMVAPVGQDVAPRCYPVAFPTDVVAFGLSCLSPGEDQIRFLCGLVRVYGEAVRLSGEVPRLRRDLERALGNLCGLLRVEARKMGVHDGGGAGDGADERDDQSGDPHEVSPSSGSEAAISDDNTIVGERSDNSDGVMAEYLKPYPGEGKR